jgi:hypothetical protein
MHCLGACFGAVLRMQASAALRSEFDNKLNETELALTGRVQSDLAGKAAAASQVEARLEGLRWAARPVNIMHAGQCCVCCMRVPAQGEHRLGSAKLQLHLSWPGVLLYDSAAPEMRQDKWSS